MADQCTVTLNDPDVDAGLVRAKRYYAKVIVPNQVVAPKQNGGADNEYVVDEEGIERSKHTIIGIPVIINHTDGIGEKPKVGDVAEVFWNKDGIKTDEGLVIDADSDLWVIITSDEEKFHDYCNQQATIFVSIGYEVITKEKIGDKQDGFSLYRVTEFKAGHLAVLPPYTPPAYQGTKLYHADGQACITQNQEDVGITNIMQQILEIKNILSSLNLDNSNNLNMNEEDNLNMNEAGSEVGQATPEDMQIVDILYADLAKYLANGEGDFDPNDFFFIKVQDLQELFTQFKAGQGANKVLNSKNDAVQRKNDFNTHVCNQATRSQNVVKRGDVEYVVEKVN